MVIFHSYVKLPVVHHGYLVTHPMHGPAVTTSHALTTTLLHQEDAIERGLGCLVWVCLKIEGVNPDVKQRCGILLYACNMQCL